MRWSFEAHYIDAYYLLDASKFMLRIMSYLRITLKMLQLIKY
jgi:hypothetical protein